MTFDNLMLDDLTRVLRTYWTQFLYALPRLLVAAVLMAVVWVVARRLRGWLAARLSQHSHDPLLTDFLTEVGRWLMVGLGLVLALNILGLSNLVGGLLAGAGLSAFIVGFAFKDIAENFLAGIILAFNRPFRINDTIQIKDMVGVVRKLNLRTTEILTFDDRDISIPNAFVLKEPLINFTRTGFIRQDFSVPVAAGTPVDTTLQRVLAAVRQDTEVTQGPGREPFVIVDELADKTMRLKIFFWTEAADYQRGVLQLRSRVMDRVQQVLQPAAP